MKECKLNQMPFNPGLFEKNSSSALGIGKSNSWFCFCVYLISIFFYFLKKGLPTAR